MGELMTDDLLALMIQAEKLLRRVEPELVPNHDAAQALSDKFGLGRVANSTLVEDIREFLALL